MKDYSSIVLSSKIVFKRNLSGFNFPSTLDENNGVKTLNKIVDTLLLVNKEFKIYKMKSLPEIDKNIMNEKGLISKELVSSVDFGAAVLNENDGISIMINETDHIVENCKKTGLNLILAYDTLNAIDNDILSKLDIAFDDEFGFLTSNLNEIGTGLGADIELFLPGLVLTGKIKMAQAEINKQGLDLIVSNSLEDGKYLFSISNSQTIGKKETDYIIKMTETAIKICEMEIASRNELLSINFVDDVKDKVFRAWGIATNCFKISELEAQNILLELKIGVALDIVRFKEVGSIDSLMQDILPYSLTKISGGKVSISELDKYRAKFLASVLKTKRIK